MEIVDANIILRFILDDNEELADKATDIIEERNIYILEEVIAEVIYVMEKVYKMERTEISESITEFIEYDNIFIDNKDVMTTALETFKEKNIDFVDSVLFGYAKCRKAKIHTFDKKLDKMIKNI